MNDFVPVPLRNLFKSVFPSRNKPPLTPHLDADQHNSPRCAQTCQYGHCTLMAEPWFARVLELERKRSERSRKPFLLVLVHLEGASDLNGGWDRFFHQVLSAVQSITRETDLTGWYRENAILGTIFTELGDSKDLEISIDSIVSKAVSALQLHLGEKQASKVDVSCHVFPENWDRKKPGGYIDTSLYPDLARRKKSRWLQSATKRTIDVLGSGLALIMLSPVLLLTALAIKISSRGPIFFRQERTGQFGELFTFFKFRSMYISNDSSIHEQYVKKLITGALDRPENGIFKIQNDPRITPLGRFLRKTSLDELPQFWNVFIGQMSLVGPRPPLPYEVQVYDVWHRRRVLEAKPGITGLWQVNGRSRTCFDDMVRLDLHYTRESSFWLDLKILLQTPRAVLAGDGAY